MEYSFDLLYSPSAGVATKNYPSVYILSDNAEYLIIWHLSRPMQAELMEFCCTSKVYTEKTWHVQHTASTKKKLHKRKVVFPVPFQSFS